MLAGWTLTLWTPRGEKPGAPPDNSQGCILLQLRNAAWHGGWGGEPVGLPSSGALGVGDGMGGVGAAPSPKRRRGAPEGAAYVTVGDILRSNAGELLFDMLIGSLESVQGEGDVESP